MSDDKKIWLWTSRDMKFHDPEKGFFKIKKYTRCYVAKYNNRIKNYLERMKRKDTYHDSHENPVAVFLDEKIRYVWRSDLLTEKEFEDIKREQRRKLGVLRKK